eukprot:TRINITY_DN11711_c0_g1_i1.p1 TRINITY_DN11711_c0_g1~~TRINITY_DN11711_c0_g1_i1.p1  ORF type:complete len:752 (+),score=244.17 TRINITY_DN11711_c0_g1_i1:254-2257(+)
MAAALTGLSVASSRGGIFEVSKRARGVPLLLAVVLLLGVFLVGVLVWGMVLYYHDNACGNPGEPEEDRGFLEATWIIQLAIILIMLIKLCVNLDYSNSATYTLADPETGGVEKYDALWTKRCQALMCCVNVEDTDIAEAAKIVAAAFGNVDMVMTDVEAGLVLLAAHRTHLAKEAQKEAGLRLDDGIAVNLPGITLNPEARPVGPFPRGAEQDLATLHTFSKYFMAAYGWPMHVLDNPCSCACSQAAARCRGFGKDWREKVSGDYCCCCACHTSAFFAQCDLDPECLLWVSWESRYSLPAFYLAVDHGLRAVVVGVRGTMNLDDVLTDGCANPLPFGEHLCEGGAAHGGMAKAAWQIAAALEAKCGLRRVLEQNDGYKLVTVGHSLGAGTAALLAIELHKTYPDVLGLAYSPPGGLMTWNLSVAADFVIGVGLGDDVVPRASIRNVHEFRDKMLATFARAPQAQKCDVICAACCMSADKLERRFEPEPGANADGAANRSPAVDETTRALMSYVASLAVACENAQLAPMFPPARYIHIMRFGTRGTSCGPCIPAELLLHPVSQDVRRLMAEGMVSSVNMVLDHLPNHVRDAIAQVLDKDRRVDLDTWGMQSGWENPLPLHHSKWERSVIAAPVELDHYQSPELYRAHRTPGAGPAEEPVDGEYTSMDD